MNYKVSFITFNFSYHYFFLQLQLQLGWVCVVSWVLGYLSSQTVDGWLYLYRGNRNCNFEYLIPFRILDYALTKRKIYMEYLFSGTLPEIPWQTCSFFMLFFKNQLFFSKPLSLKLSHVLFYTFAHFWVSFTFRFLVSYAQGCMAVGIFMNLPSCSRIILMFFLNILIILLYDLWWYKCFGNCKLLG